MPKCSILPPTASTAAGITSRRSAMADAPNTTTSSAPAFSTSSIALATAPCSCGTRRSATMVAPAGASRASVTRSVFSTTLVARPGSSVETMPTFLILIGRDADERLAAATASAASSEASLDRERNDLHRRDHLAFDHRLERRQRRERDRLVDAVEPVDRILVDHQHAGAFGEQIAAAGEGAVDAHALARPPPRRSRPRPCPRTRRPARAAPPRSP